MSDSIQNDVRDAAKHGQAAVRDAYDQVSDAVPSFADAARATADAFRVAGRKASAVMADLKEEALDTGARTREQVASRVQSQPMTSVLVAAALGLIAGLLISRQ